MNDDTQNMNSGEGGRKFLFNAEQIRGTLFRSFGSDYIEKYHWSIIPTDRKTKRPCIAWKAFQSCRATELDLETWDREFPDANIALVTGRISGIVVVDCDTPAAEAFAAANFPPTPAMAKTARGRHRFYLYPGWDVPCSAGKIYPGLDVRGTGGFVVIAPSVHQTGVQYEWEFAAGGDPWENLPVYQEPGNAGVIISPGRPGGNLNVDLSNVRPFYSEHQGPVIEGGRHDALTEFVGQKIREGLKPSDVLKAALAENATYLAEDGINLKGLPEREVQTIVESLFQSDVRNHQDKHQAVFPQFGPNDPPILLRREPGQQAPYPTACFLQFEKMILDLSDAISVPVSIVGSGVLGVGSLLTMHIANAWTSLTGVTPLALFLISVLESGGGKSLLDSILMQEINKAERELLKQYRIDRQAYDESQEKFKTQCEGLQNQLKRGKISEEKFDQALEDLKKKTLFPPVLPVFTISNGTIEGVIRFLSESRPAVGMFSAEGGIQLTGVAFSADARTRTMTTLNSIWSGATIDKYRSGEGGLKLFNRRVALHQMIQPVLVPRLLDDSVAKDTGFALRCLWTHPAPMRRVIEGKGNLNPRKLPSVLAFYDCCKRLLAVPLKDDRENPDNGLFFETMTLSADAWGDFEKFAQSMADASMKGGLYEGVHNFATRIPENALRIAAILTLLHDPDAKEIDGNTMGAACELAEWYLQEIQRVITEEIADTEVNEAEKLLQWLFDHNFEFTSVNQVVRYGPPSMRKSKTVKNLLAVLETNGWIERAAGGAMIQEGKKQVPAKTAWRVRLEWRGHIQK